MKKHILFVLFSVLAFTSCTKDDPIQEIDQEELSSATLIFTPVVKASKDGVTTYTPMADEEAQSIKFAAPSYLPPVDTHLDLHVGHTYKLELKTTDFAGRASEQTFLNRPENHQAFLLGANNSEIDFVYGDANNVGITAYITVKKESSIVLNYIMRHLRPNVKQNITAADWNNKEYVKFTGDNDLDLKFSAHLVADDHGH